MWFENECRKPTMCHIAPKVLAHNDMPGRAMASVKFLLDLCGNVLLDVVFLESSGRDVDAFLLHVLTHIDILDDGLGPYGAIVFFGAGTGVGG